MHSAIEGMGQEVHEVKWPVSVWLPSVSMFFNGRSLKISKIAVLVHLPNDMPITIEDEPELNFPRTETLAKKFGQYGRLRGATIVDIEQLPYPEGIQVTFKFT